MVTEMVLSMTGLKFKIQRLIHGQSEMLVQESSWMGRKMGRPLKA